MTALRLEYLLAKYAANSCTKSEFDELYVHFAAAGDEEMMQVMNEEYLKIRVEENATGVDWDHVFNEIIVQKKSVPVRILQNSTTWILRWACAAVVIFVLGVGAYLWNSKPSLKPQVVSSNSIAGNDVTPGGQRATLTLSNGRTIFLDSTSSSRLATEGPSNIIKQKGQIIYSVGSLTSSLRAAETYNTMSTPRGGQYLLTLSDGTNVWLNSSSSITYPVAFTGNTREVSITGEAYFRVRKNSSKPFIVKSVKDKIKVLGTQFNINAYSDGASTKTSLVEGSVKINEKILKPGQAYMNGEIIQTNIEQDIAWKNGLFNFQGKSFAEAMRQLSRWYDIDIVYQGSIPSVTVMGEMGRDLNLSEVLQILSNMNVRFRLEGRRLIILQ